MAPLSFTLATATSTCSPFFSQTPIQQRPLKTHAKQTHRFHVSCNVSSDNHEKPLNTNPPPQKLILPQTPSLDLQNVDRRNLLLGLGGLYTTVNLTDLPPAFAKPITSPPIGESLKPTCKPAESGFNSKLNPVRSAECCPPASKKGPEKDYVLTRVRKPIHKSPDDVKKYRDALEKMRALPDDDPRSFTNQAKIHCAYCNGSYMKDGKELQIHNSWLFFPFHRWYLYFYERILGELIEDPHFALPYWNWDNPDGGMVIPDLFIRDREDSKSNSLFDEFRNQDHLLKTAVVDLDFHDPKKVDQREINLATMNRQMMRNSFDATSFFGGRYVAGNEPIQRGDNVVGSIEAGCHTAVHRWVGRPGDNNHEDMGNFYSAGYDPLFYVHHANVDRMWTLWKEMGGKEPTDEDWGNASYVFYDEKQNPVRVYNKDAVNLDKLGYQYAKSETPWTQRPPRSRCYRPDKPVRAASPESFPEKDKVTFPLRILDNIVRLKVPRPPACINRSAEEKKKEREILCFYGIMFDGTTTVKFDVLVNECDTDEFTACDSENVGSFAAIPHAKGGSMGCKTGMRYSISELLEETGKEGDKSITVTIKPPLSPQNKNTSVVTIEDIEIRLIPVLQKE